MYALLVKDVYKLHGNASITIDEGSSLEEVINIFARDPGIRGVFLIDKHKRFSGMVSRLAIMKWAEFQLFNRWKTDIPDPYIADIIDTVTAKSLARGDRRTFGVMESDKLEKAFNQMMKFEEDVIPVFDADGAIIGDLRLSEVLLKAIQQVKKNRESR